jgi:hypothetical protein
MANVRTRHFNNQPPATGKRWTIKGLPLGRVLLLVLFACCGAARSQTWFPITTPQFTFGSVALQLTDGTIMVQQSNYSSWWRLRPGKFGSYNTGTWSPMPSMPAGYAPKGFASAVLPDGRVIIEGGEYNNGIKVDTNLGAIYDPFTNTWASVSPPAGWTKIGDAPSIVLPDGTFMLGTCCGTQAALLDASTLTWTDLTTASGYKGKFDSNNEEGWTLLPGFNGGVLTVDTHAGSLGNGSTNSEVYNPSAGAWTSAGSTVAQLWDSRNLCGVTGATHEIGPAVLRPDGTVFATGANSCPSTAGHTAVYDSLTGTWAPGFDVPGVNDAADASASILPDGNVLVETNPGVNNSPSTFYEYSFDGSGWVVIPQPTGLTPSSTEFGRMLVIPTGGVLFLHRTTAQAWVYKAAGTYKSAWRPTICPGCYPSVCIVGQTYTVTGTQFNGLSQGAAYGDDVQSATNYPLVQITNNATGHKFFARTHDHSTMAVATGNAITSTQFDILPTSSGTEFGASTLVVIANGIPSKPVGITVSR